MSRGRLVAVSGVDCAGKSTQLALLEQALLARGERVRRVWFRPGYSREADALRAAVRRVRPGALPRAEVAVEARARAFARRDVRGAWVLAAAADVLLQCAVKARWALARGETLLCDRWLEDARIDLELRFPDEVGAGTLDAVWARCPAPDVALLLMVDPEEIARRAALKAEPFADPPELRARRYQRYAELAATGRVQVVQAGRPIADVQREMLSWST